jgi:hypothetical protein
VAPPVQDIVAAVRLVEVVVEQAAVTKVDLVVEQEQLDRDIMVVVLLIETAIVMEQVVRVVEQVQLVDPQLVLVV